jgi:hypothetical protein
MAVRFQANAMRSQSDDVAKRLDSCRNRLSSTFGVSEKLIFWDFDCVMRGDAEEAQAECAARS